MQLEIPREQAGTWLQYLSAECARRGWSAGSIGQLDARENSGSITINPSTSGKPPMEVVWERKRGGPLKVRARAAGDSVLPLSEAQQLFEQVSEKCRTEATEQFYCRGQLHYHGLPWRSELWLDKEVRLGPPALHYDRALCGPRVILADMMVDCIGRSDLGFAFDHKLRELSAFLSVVMGTTVELPKRGYVWTFATGNRDCDVRSLGYFEPENPQEMPAPGSSRAMLLRSVGRPDFSLRGIDGSTDEESLPADTADLWAKYRLLAADERRTFLQSASKWREAMSHWSEERTRSFALLVVACEALKPSGREFREHNVYQVVEALLGRPVADRLKEEWFRPQDIRSAHMHRGEFRSSEFVRTLIMSSYQDPTFDSAHRAMAKTTQAAIIEWLSRGGRFTIPLEKPRRTARRWAKDHLISVLLTATTLAAAVGVLAGWLLRGFWHG
jgi:hypothetical protein